MSISPENSLTTSIVPNAVSKYCGLGYDVGWTGLSSESSCRFLLAKKIRSYSETPYVAFRHVSQPILINQAVFVLSVAMITGACIHGCFEG